MAKRKSSEKRKEEIFEATLKIIHEEGKENLTIRRIAKQVNISEAAIYRHFNNKKDIITQLTKNIFTQKPWDIEENFNNPSQSLKTLINSIFSDLEENPHLTSFLFHEELFAEYPELLKMFHRYRQRKIKKIMQFIQKAQNKGKISSNVDPETFAEILIGSIQISILQWQSKKHPYSLKNKSEKLSSELSKILEP